MDKQIVGPDGKPPEKTPARAVETTPFSITPPPPEVVDVRDASGNAVELLRQRVKNQHEMLKIAIALTSPSQWVLHTDGQRQSVYPTGGAADTILRRAFGCTFEDKSVKIGKDEKGRTEAVATATLCQGGRPIEQFEGRRRLGGYIKNEADMIKGAMENLKSVALRDLLGLRFRSVDDLKSLGLDPAKMTTAEHEQHDESDSPAAPGEAVVQWGRKKGAPISKLDVRELDYYAGKAREAIADPSKAKWKSREERWLAAILAEQERRKAKPAPSAPPTPEDPDPRPPEVRLADAKAALREQLIKKYSAEKVDAKLAGLTTLAAVEELVAKMVASEKADPDRPGADS